MHGSCRCGGEHGKAVLAPTRDSKPRSTSHPTPFGKQVAAYSYGTYRVVRHDLGNGDKRFVQQRLKDGITNANVNNSGHWERGIQGVARRLYYQDDLPSQGSGDLVLFGEGEKVVEAARQLGFHATTNSGGSGATWVDGHELLFTGNHVCILADDDDAGQKHAQKVAQQLTRIAASVKTRFIVEGCLEWQSTGLAVPDEVRQATAEYRTEMDVLAGFIDECCVVSPRAFVGASPLFEAYKQWADRNGERQWTQRRFGTSLGERGFEQGRETTKTKRHIWKGIRLLVDGGTDGTDGNRSKGDFPHIPLTKDTFPDKGSNGLHGFPEAVEEQSEYPF
jgi:Poxvirus D5 protein-like